MRFRYPLQKIVDLKGSEKSMAEWDYAASLGRLREEEARLRELQEARADAETHMADTAAAPVALSELASLQHYLNALDGKIRLQLSGVASAEKVVHLRRGKLVEKSVDEKVWLNARDRALQVHRSEWLRTHQNELDEMAIVRAASSRN